MENIEYISLSANNIRQEILNLRQLVFEVTDSCNLKCKYCGYGEFYCSYDKRETRNLSFQRAKRLIDYIFSMWKEHGQDVYKHSITFSFYGGEPLLNVPLIRQIQDYVETNYAYCVDLNYSMTSNAMLLDRYMDFLVEKNFSLLISLDGDKEGQAYRVDHHGVNSFERVYANVKLLQEKYPDYFKEKVHFNSVLHDRNSTDGLFHYMQDTFGKIPMISQLNTSGIREDKREEFKSLFVSKDRNFYEAPDVPLLINEMFFDVPDTRALYTYLEQFSGNVYKSYTDLFVDQSKLPSFPTGTCVPFNRKMFLTVNGKILACERIDQKYALGYVTDEGVDLDFEKIAAFYNTFFEKIKKQCQGCYRKSYCPQCIFYIEDLEGEALCDGFMKEDEFERMVVAQKAYLRRNPHLYKRIMEELAIY
ncbi:radical SAM peptide maturase [Parabacteroides sp. AM08-6]|uniref:radical SAM peptide maturase n=1 Tax=Parabacteroides sp. AM08-6 TaxID=2292053 RepID=UPI000F00AD4A|nr:radical SAM peptide maturase [Parabacteroides sp. AM08-6]RHJ75311.1 radical SAM peptide maturase [Parabacteroides sp. AM08-6]